ncbi:MAG: SPOR domain-containing protein [Ignavibacteriales bacterium]|nr:SPOR domain-containing protein [Ignavibacteriales bacterium]
MVKFYIPRFTLLMLFLFIAQIAPAFSAGSLSFNPEQGAIVPLEKGFGVVLLSGPNLEDAKKMGKKYSENGITVRVVKNDKMKKNRYRVVAGLFSKRTDAEF